MARNEDIAFSWFTRYRDDSSYEPRDGELDGLRDRL